MRIKTLFRKRVLCAIGIAVACLLVLLELAAFLIEKGIIPLNAIPVMVSYGISVFIGALAATGDRKMVIQSAGVTALAIWMLFTAIGATAGEYCWSAHGAELTAAVFCSAVPAALLHTRRKKRHGTHPKKH